MGVHKGTRHALLAGVVASVCVWQSAVAQPNPSGARVAMTPIGWRTRVDAAGNVLGDKGAGERGNRYPDARAGDTLAFTSMTPGFHITTGPGTVLWHPDSTAQGSYAITSSIFLFPTQGRDREGYGVFIGGQQLDGAGQRYTYFLLRNDGKFLVKRREGDATTTLKDWTYLTAIKLVKGKEPRQNDITVTAGPQTVTFLVNGKEAVTLPRDQVAPDGVFGLRVNHALSVHVTKLSRAG